MGWFEHFHIYIYMQNYIYIYIWAPLSSVRAEDKGVSSAWGPPGDPHGNGDWGDLGPLLGPSSLQKISSKDNFYHLYLDYKIFTAYNAFGWVSLNPTVQFNRTGPNFCGHMQLRWALTVVHLDRPNSGPRPRQQTALSRSLELRRGLGYIYIYIYTHATHPPAFWRIIIKKKKKRPMHLTNETKESIFAFNDSCHEKEERKGLMHDGSYFFSKMAPNLSLSL